MTETASAIYERSRAEHERRSAVIAGGVNSNVRLAGNPVPLTFDRAHGARLWDVDGNEYLDYAAGMGPMILGHNHPTVTTAVRESLETGQLFAGQNLLEAEFAELLVDTIPWIESVRVGLTGTEMDLLAIRIARAATGRTKVIRFAGHYHGWLDPLFVNPAEPATMSEPAAITAGQSALAASELVVCEWNDLDQFEQAMDGDDVACVLMEPIMCNTGLIAPAPGYLEGVKERCRRSGALLIIDEVITGFRMGLTGAQGMLGVTGDISVYAKAIASGFPLAVLSTSTELLAGVGRGEVNHSGTYNTGVSSMAAGIATVRCLREEDPYPEMGRQTTRLAEGLRSAGARVGVELAVDHIGGSLVQTRFGPAGPVTSRAEFAAGSDAAMLTQFLDRLQAEGVRPTSRGLWFVSAAHDAAIIDATVAAAERAMAGMV